MRGESRSVLAAAPLPNPLPMEDGERELGRRLSLSSYSLAGLAEVQKCVQHSAQIVVDISILDSIDQIAQALQLSGSQGITWLLVFCGVRGAIHFNNDLEFSTKKINEEMANRRLPNKLQTTEASTTQLLPKSGFR